MIDGKSITQLYHDAKNAGSLQFIFSLLRAEGWTTTPDQIRALYPFLQGIKQQIKNGTLDDAEQVFKTLITARDTYSLLFNLIGNAVGETYKIAPLPSARNEMGFATGTPPTNGEHIDAILDKAKTYAEKNPAFCRMLEETFNDEVKKIYRNERNFDANQDLEHLKRIVDFLHDLLKKYYRILKDIGQQDPKLFPFPATFDVFELLADKAGELYGINVHHSGGSHSFFKRYPNRTEQMAYSFTDQGEIAILHGPGNAPHMWMFDGKPFYERGFPGRYNAIGEWKPIIYPGESQEIQTRAREAAKDENDKRVEGCLFYAMATCHHAIEFVVKSNFEIPYDFLSTTAGELTIQLHKVEMPDIIDVTNNNIQVYDGTAFIPAIDVETIGGALDAIGVVLNRIAFRVDGKVEWKIKYSTYGDGGGKHQISKKHFDELGEYLLGLNSPDVGLVDTAISWYTTAKNSPNIFTKYLNYYIAVESLSVALVDGEMKIGEKYGIEPKGRAERKTAAEESIRKIHDEIYQTDPISFVKKAYAEAIGSLRAKTELALKKVFGEEHKYVQEFLDKSEGKNMYELRNDLAHGSFNHIDRDEAHTIRKKLAALEDIAYHFIMKLSVGPDKKYMRFSRFSMSMSMADPRNTMVASNLRMFPRKDWKIQWEWLD